ncbi:type VII secretion protein EssB [Streptococcus sp. DD13]|uniref:type VII secretion protein EssB n=1 Tax=Streptococcus sp. DD13 TaxID=1777881 RepID=UPI000798AB0F|nr:type VII secretion protein EssB [Streptococcus sp. DD13]KXT77715.1 putative secretion system component EssB/YukC [Streptococcus sp. DD13]
MTEAGELNVSFGGTTYCYEKGEEEWKVRIPRSEVATQEVKRLQLLNLQHPLLLEQSVSWDEKEIVFRYALETHGLSLEDVRKKCFSEQLRIVSNVLDLEACFSLPITFFLHPETLFISKNGLLKLSYRGLPHVMPPREMNQEDFLRQVKCFVVAVLSEMEYTALYEGSLEVAKLPTYLNEIVEAPSSEEIRFLLERAYQDQLAEEAEEFQLVSKKHYRLYKYSSLWASLAACALLFPLLYFIFLRTPYYQALLDADTSFVKEDYSGLVTQLSFLQIDDLPYTQQYQLAYSVVKTLDVSEEQRDVIMQNISMKSKQLYLRFWIEIGREDYEGALDTAKRLEDIQLILYALDKRATQVRKDEHLSGKERETLMDKLQKDIADYRKQWQEATASTDSSGTGTSTTRTLASSD